MWRFDHPTKNDSRLPPLRSGEGGWGGEVVFLLLASALHAAEPAVRNADVRGLQVGKTTRLTLDGDDLGTAPRLLLPFAAKQSLKPGANGKRAAFDVTLDAAVVP